MSPKRLAARLFAVGVVVVSAVPTVCLAGTIVGKVALDGRYDVAGKSALDPDELIRAQRAVVVSAKGRLANVVVSIEGVAPTGVPAGDLPEIDQKEKTFVPHVLPIVRDQKVQFVNSDRILHNLHAYDGQKTLFNTAMPLQNQHLSVRIATEGDTVMVSCDVHKHMRAWILLRDNPYFAVSKESGLFSIPDVPSGTYTIRAWHEVFGTLEQTITVKDGPAKTPVIFTYHVK